MSKQSRFVKHRFLWNNNTTKPDNFLQKPYVKEMLQWKVQQSWILRYILSYEIFVLLNNTTESCSVFMTENFWFFFARYGEIIGNRLWIKRKKEKILSLSSYFLEIL